MELTKKNQLSLFGKESGNDTEVFKKWTFLILSNWLVFSVSIFLGLTIAYLVVRNTIPVFKVTSTVLIKPQQKTLLSESLLMSGFESGDNENFINQTILLKTPSQVRKTLSQLNFNICYYSKGRFNVREFYPDQPFVVRMDSTHVQPLNLEIHIEPAPNGKIRLNAEGENITLYNFQLNKEMGTLPNIAIDQEIIPGQACTTPNYSFTLSPSFTDLKKIANEGDYYFVFKSNDGMVKEFSTLELDYAVKGATVVNLFHTGSNLEKSKTFLNQLMNDWIQSDLDKKNEIANNTINFINKQLAGLGDTLKSVSSKLQNFRTSNNVVSPDIQVQSSYAKLEALDAEQALLQMQIVYLDQMESYLNKREDYNKLIAPSSVGLEMGEFGTYLKQLSEIRAELFQYMGQNKLNNPYLQNRQKQESILLNSIREYMKNVRDNIDLKIERIVVQKKRYTLDQNKQPAKEQELFGIERSYKTTDNLYTLLQEKIIEAQIKKASNVADNQVVEKAVYFGMVKPERSKIMAIGGLIGLMIPLLFLFLTDLFNNKIQSGDDIKQLTRIPIYGNITEGKD
ncbi:MAG: GNVR domain-containing protein, partial [Mariniphaga sp.]